MRVRLNGNGPRRLFFKVAERQQVGVLSKLVAFRRGKSDDDGLFSATNLVPDRREGEGRLEVFLLRTIISEDLEDRISVRQWRWVFQTAKRDVFIKVSATRRQLLIDFLEQPAISLVFLCLLGLAIIDFLVHRMGRLDEWLLRIAADYLHNVLRLFYIIGLGLVNLLRGLKVAH
jgi:hypothetical protein